MVVAAPGRARDLLQSGHLRLDACRTLVLDEADLLLSALDPPPRTPRWTSPPS